MGLSVVLVVHDLSNGCMARARALAEVLDLLGHQTRTVSAWGEEVWPPARGTPFAASAARLSRRGVADAVGGADLVIAVKVLPQSLGLALQAAVRSGVPIIADVDDPDVEARTQWAPARSLLSQAVHHPKHYAQLRALRWAARRLTTTVSNPVLQSIYGGELVPHAVPDRGAGQQHTSDRPLLSFIGTVGPHKGVGLLRAATARLHEEGWRLLVTAEPPPDARPWETWTGPRVPDSRALLQRSDVVVIASGAPDQAAGEGLQADYARAQLPLKLIEAMLAARAVVVSDYGPLPWAARAAPVVPVADVDALVAALRPLADPELRNRLGGKLREEAIARYTPAAVAPGLERAIARALVSSPWPRWHARTRPTSDGAAVHP